MITVYLYGLPPTIIPGVDPVMKAKYCFNTSIPEWEKIITDSPSNVEQASLVFLVSSQYISVIKPRSNSLVPLSIIKISDVRVHLPCFLISALSLSQCSV